MWRNKKGQGLVEMALVLPILLLLLMGIIEFGFLFAAKIEIQNAARDGARWASIGKMQDTEIIDQLIEDRFVILKNETDNITVTITTTNGTSKKVTIDYIYNSITPLGIGNGKNIGSSVTMRLE